MMLHTSVGGHLLLGYNDLLGAVDDEVPPGVEGALVELCQVPVTKRVEGAVARPQHDGNLADVGLLVLCLHRVLSVFYHSLSDVHVYRRRVPAHNAGIRAWIDTIGIAYHAHESTYFVGLHKQPASYNTTPSYTLEVTFSPYLSFHYFADSPFHQNSPLQTNPSPIIVCYIVIKKLRRAKA